MRFLFICGSLEPGKDGVGDYVRHLSGELIRKGHEVSAVAINDKLIEREQEEEYRVDGNVASLLRLPSIWPSDQRFSKAAAFSAQFRPDWISFQFVPYSFQDKGLPSRLRNLIGLIGWQQRWHIMFHELWLGFTPDSPFKEKLVGFFQRRIMTSFTRFMKPQLVTTSNALYAGVLEENNIPARILPLFSNIPVAARDGAFIAGVLEQLGIRESERAHWCIMGIFGNIYPSSNLENTIAEQLGILKGKRQNLAILGFGNLHASGWSEFRRLQEVFSDSVKFLHLGIQAPHHVSNLIQMLDAGISCTPSEHIPKSGAFATMRLHGIPVILPKDINNIEMNEATMKYVDYHMNRAPDSWNVAYVAEQFLQMLKEIGKADLGASKGSDYH